MPPDAAKEDHPSNGSHRIQFYHWWPGRQYRGASPIPSFITKQAERQGTRYLTVAIGYGQDGSGPFFGFAHCCPKDNPSRRLGRTIAEGRLRDALKGCSPF